MITTMFITMQLFFSFLCQGKQVPWLPGLVFTVVSISTGIMALFLPETLGRPLPQTIEEIENWTRTVSQEEKDAIKKVEKSYQIRLENMKTDDATETSV